MYVARCVEIYFMTEVFVGSIARKYSKTLPMMVIAPRDKPKTTNRTQVASWGSILEE
jgi:hypothetical protein